MQAEDAQPVSVNAKNVFDRFCHNPDEREVTYFQTTKAKNQSQRLGLIWMFAVLGVMLAIELSATRGPPPLHQQFKALVLTKHSEGNTSSSDALCRMKTTEQDNEKKRRKMRTTLLNGNVW